MNTESVLEQLERENSRATTTMIPSFIERRLMPMLMESLRNRKQTKAVKLGQAEARKELYRIAAMADKYIAIMREDPTFEYIPLID